MGRGGEQALPGTLGIREGEHDQNCRHKHGLGWPWPRGSPCYRHRHAGVSAQPERANTALALLSQHQPGWAVSAASARPRAGWHGGWWRGTVHDGASQPRAAARVKMFSGRLVHTSNLVTKIASISRRGTSPRPTFNSRRPTAPPFRCVKQHPTRKANAIVRIHRSWKGSAPK